MIYIFFGDIFESIFSFGGGSVSVVTLLLSFFLSQTKDTEEMSETFILVFVLMWVGGVIITINTILLGAHM